MPRPHHTDNDIGLDGSCDAESGCAEGRLLDWARSWYEACAYRPDDFFNGSCYTELIRRITRIVRECGVVSEKPETRILGVSQESVETGKVHALLRQWDGPEPPMQEWVAIHACM